jgi:uncharacterized membrane protein
MQAQNIIFPAQILRGAGAVSRIGEVCGLLGSRALIIGGIVAWRRWKRISAINWRHHR